MRTAALREELRERDVLLEADGLTLHVDAPAGPSPRSCAPPSASTSAP